MLYFAGLKNADCAPIMNSTAINSHAFPSQKPNAAPDITTISANFTHRIRVERSYLSAKSEAVGANMKNGNMNTPAAAFTRIRGSTPEASPILYVISIINALLKKLSLKAPRNCVRNKGMNLRTNNSFSITVHASISFPAEYPQGQSPATSMNLESRPNARNSLPSSPLHAPV